MAVFMTNSIVEALQEQAAELARKRLVQGALQDVIDSGSLPEEVLFS